MMNSYFEIPTAIAKFYIDSSLRAFQSINMAGEHSERIARIMLDNSKAAREEGLKVVQRWADLGRESHRVFTDTCNNAVNVGIDNYRSASQKALGEVAKQVDRINKQVEAAVPAAPAAKAAKG